MEKKNLKISVCIPSIYPENLKMCIATLKVQEKKPYQILVYKKKGSRSKARNWLLKKAEGDLVLLTDDDVVFHPKTLKMVEKFFIKHKEIKIAQGVEISPFIKFSGEEKVWKTNYLDTVICVLRKEVAKKITMDEKDQIIENLSLAEELQKRGYQLWMTNAFYVYHLPKNYEHFVGSRIRNTISQINRFKKTKNIKHLFSPFLVPLKNNLKMTLLSWKASFIGFKKYMSGEKKALQYDNKKVIK